MNNTAENDFFGFPRAKVNWRQYTGKVGNVKLLMSNFVRI